MSDWMDYYGDAYDVDFTVYGILSWDDNEYDLKFQNEYIGYIESANPLTKEIYDAMTPEQQKKAVPSANAIFTMVGGQGLNLISGGRAQKRLGEIIKKWQDVAETIAREARKNAGWKTGPRNDYRITPEGKTTTSNGFPIGRFAMPWGDDDAGEFDGTITDETKFTK